MLVCATFEAFYCLSVVSISALQLPLLLNFFSLDLDIWAQRPFVWCFGRYYGVSPTNISLTDILPTGHFADRHFTDGKFADNPDITPTIHFADRQIADRDYFDRNYTTVRYFMGLLRKIYFALVQQVNFKYVLCNKQQATYTLL